MTIQQALAVSTNRWPMATGRSASGKEVTAARHGNADCRIVRDVTDPTVLRKLSKHELAATDWQPVMSQDDDDKWPEGW
jgi:hypothetical protein